MQQNLTSLHPGECKAKVSISKNKRIEKDSLLAAGKEIMERYNTNMFALKPPV